MNLVQFKYGGTWPNSQHIVPQIHATVYARTSCATMDSKSSNRLGGRRSVYTTTISRITAASNPPGVSRALCTTFPLDIARCREICVGVGPSRCAMHPHRRLAVSPPWRTTLSMLNVKLFTGEFGTIVSPTHVEYTWIMLALSFEACVFYECIPLIK